MEPLSVWGLRGVELEFSFTAKKKKRGEKKETVDSVGAYKGCE